MFQLTLFSLVSSQANERFGGFETDLSRRFIKKSQNCCLTMAKRLSSDNQQTKNYSIKSFKYLDLCLFLQAWEVQCLWHFETWPWSGITIKRVEMKLNQWDFISNGIPCDHRDIVFGDHGSKRLFWFTACFTNFKNFKAFLESE